MLDGGFCLDSSLMIIRQVNDGRDHIEASHFLRDLSFRHLVSRLKTHDPCGEIVLLEMLL